MTGGIVFIITSLVGGFVSSVGTDLYHILKNIIANGSELPLSLPQLIFLMIGISGLGLLVSALVDTDTPSKKKDLRAG